LRFDIDQSGSEGRPREYFHQTGTVTMKWLFFCWWTISDLLLAEVEGFQKAM
jgi:hypothetical protein